VIILANNKRFRLVHLVQRRIEGDRIKGREKKPQAPSSPWYRFRQRTSPEPRNWPTESTEIFTLCPTAKRYRDFLEMFRYLDWHFAVPRTVGCAVFIDIPLTTQAKYTHRAVNNSAVWARPHLYILSYGLNERTLKINQYVGSGSRNWDLLWSFCGRVSVSDYTGVPGIKDWILVVWGRHVTYMWAWLAIAAE